MTRTNRFTNARISDGGSTRGGDMSSHDLFKIEGPDGPTFYGDYIYSCLENGNDFNIDIGTFGYVDPQRVASSDPTAREQFSGEECSAAEKLILTRFLSEPDIYRKRSLKANFVGGVKLSTRLDRPNTI